MIDPCAIKVYIFLTFNIYLNHCQLVRFFASNQFPIIDQASLQSDDTFYSQKGEMMQGNSYSSNSDLQNDYNPIDNDYNNSR